MNTEIIKEYAELKIEEKRVKARLEELAPDVKAEIVAAEVDKLPTSLGTFTIKKVKKWSYSETTKQLEADLKARKAMEEAEGIAEFMVQDQMEFREAKPESSDE